jgi:hypothetical protein
MIQVSARRHEESCHLYAQRPSSSNGSRQGRPGGGKDHCCPFATIGNRAAVYLSLRGDTPDAKLHGRCDTTCGQAVLETVGCADDFHLHEM